MKALSAALRSRISFGSANGLGLSSSPAERPVRRRLLPAWRDSPRRVPLSDLPGHQAGRAESTLPALEVGHY